MNLSGLLLAGLLPAFFQPAYRPVSAVTYGVGDWRLTIAKDAFTKETRCRLHRREGLRPAVSVTPATLQIDFGRSVDTSDTWFSLDDAPPRPTQGLRAALLAQGAMNQVESLENPTAGRVIIPLSTVIAASSITVRTSPRTAPRRFDLTGFTGLIASANGLGCGFH